ncbi:class 1 isoprenoid biosynthesis enzyme [Candidatus Chloroploca sp. Khr17]|uniref:class 1 isoprenoid biosynthesis enzyme n=1 Tax=Candidatus Chloroploca sp. Khr17 TaxID=2496869 RepID=UPI00101E14DB|nr:class 1 isoprenoid biosynthesis enzyme [Candidatus Chloroploca sp. Khr17]
MLSGKLPLHYNEEDLLSTPTAFENQLLEAFSCMYSEEISKIFTKIDEQTSSNNWHIYKSKIERHFYPALILSTALEIDKNYIVNLCAAFAIGYSLPVIMLDKSLDSNTVLNSTSESFRDSLKLIYRANHYLIEHKYYKAFQCFNQHYLGVMSSMEREVNLKFKIPSINTVNQYTENVLIHYCYYRSECHYFSAIIEGILCQTRYKFSKELKVYLGIFGLLRQLSDEIADVEDDLQTGLVTLPVLFTHQSQDLSIELHDYWKGTVGFEIFKNALLNNDGYEKTYNLGVELYKISNKMKYKLLSKYPIVEHLSVFLDWRFAFLNRLRQNNWVDIRKSH